MQKARRHPEGLRPLVSVWFQDLFHSVIHGSFHLSLTVLVHYRSLRSIQPYRMVPADSDRVSRAPPYSGSYQVINLFRLQDFHPLWFNFPVNSAINLQSILQSYNPTDAQTTVVWAIPISLAATEGITFVFFSSGYLDVSVRRVCLHCWITCLQHAGLSHSEIFGSSLMCKSPKLIAAYRVLLRL